MQETLEEVLANEREDVEILRRNGHHHDVEIIERILDRVKRATEDWRTWLPEKDAELRSGRRVQWLRRQFAQWMEDGNAKLVEGKRYYRQAVVPRRGNTSAAREAGRQAGREAAA